MRIRINDVADKLHDDMLGQEFDVIETQPSGADPTKKAYRVMRACGSYFWVLDNECTKVYDWNIASDFVIDIRDIRGSGKKISSDDVEEKRLRNLLKPAILSHECPCGIARAQCDYHK